MSRRDFALTKSHRYKAPRMHIKKEALKREVFKKKIKLLFFTIVFLGVMASVFYWLFFSPLFLIDHVEVKGEAGETHTELEDIINRKLAEKVALWLSRRNYFLFSKKSVLSSIEGATLNPPIENVYIEKKFPRHMLVTFQRKMPRLTLVAERIVDDEEEGTDNITKVVMVGDSVETQETIADKVQKTESITRYYLIDDDGLVVEEIDQKKSGFPHVYIETSSRYIRGEKILTKDLVSGILSLSNEFMQFSKIDIDYFVLPSINYVHEITVVTKQGYFLYMSLDYPTKEQVMNAVLTLQKINDILNLEYIDLRIEHRAYACCNLKKP